jgi:hypothetical protein
MRGWLDAPKLHLLQQGTAMKSEHQAHQHLNPATQQAARNAEALQKLLQGGWNVGMGFTRPAPARNQGAKQ